MFKILKWQHILILAIVTLFLMSIISRVKGQEGTFTNLKDDLVSEDMLINNLYSGRDLKNESKGESIVRRCLQNIFDKPFENVRIDEMKNKKTLRNMELDCYNEDLKIAAEYQGIQHYKFVPFFHTTIENFKRQRERDLIKKSLCKENGIFLITVPYNLKHDRICRFIKSELIKYDKMPVEKNTNK